MTPSDPITDEMTPADVLRSAKQMHAARGVSLWEKLSPVTQEAYLKRAAKAGRLPVSHFEALIAPIAEHVRQLESALAAERAKNAELRDALRPFADYSQATDPGDWAGEGEIGEQIVGGLRRSIRLSDLRRAARVLAGTDGGTGE